MKGERTYTAPISAALIAILLIAGFIKAPVIKRQLNDWKLLPRPEKLTELYFENHTHLPSSYTVGTPQSFTFTVHNIEYQTLTYHYVISQQPVDASAAPQTLASGSFVLAQDKYHTQPITVTPVDLGAKAKITTSLSPVNESIDYLVGKAGA